MPWMNLVLILILAAIVGVIQWRISHIQRKLWALEADNRRLWQFIQRKMPGTVEKKDG